MSLESRMYNDLNDHSRVMEFLRRVFLETSSFENWLPPRFENNSRDMDAWTRIWEVQGEIIGLAIPETKRRYFVQLHPDCIQNYGNMIDWIEEYNKNCFEERVKLSIVELEGNDERKRILLSKGYTRESIYGIFRIRDIESPIPDFALPLGFSVRSVTPEDYEEIARCIRQVFGHGDWFTRETLESIARASFYKVDLDLIVVNEQDRIVSFCTFRFDAPTGITELEPMGTLGEYRGRGLGRALISEGLKRLKKYEPSLIYIGGAADTPAANRLYEVTGFTQMYNMFNWVKSI